MPGMRTAPPIAPAQLAKVAAFVIQARTADAVQVAAQLQLPHGDVQRMLQILHQEWGVLHWMGIGPHRVLIHPKHVKHVTERITAYGSTPPERHPFAELVMPPLTAQHQKIIRLIAAGMSNAEIAAVLHISPHTVKTHVSALFQFFRVNSREQLVFHAVYAGVFGDIPRQAGDLDV